LENLIKIAKEHGLTNDLIDQLLNISTIEKIKNKTVLLDYGEKTNKIYYILKGGFVTKAWNEEKQIEKTISFNLNSFHPHMTEAKAYFFNLESENKIQAISNATVLSYYKSDLDKIASENNSFNKFSNHMIIQSLISENQLRSKLLTYSPKKFYTYLLDEHPEIIKTIPSKDIASFLGISEVWMSNIKHDL